MMVHYKVLSSNDKGSECVIENTVDQPGTFEEIKARFLRDMPKIFPDGPLNTMEFFIEPVHRAR